MQLLYSCLRPYPVFSGLKKSYDDKTIPFRFSLDTRGLLVLEFQIVVSNARSGAPKVGFIDAEAAPAFGQWPGDLSRGHAGAGPFAIGFCPASGTMCASRDAIRRQNTTSAPPAGQITRSKRRSGFYAAKLKWDKIGDCKQTWNTPVHAALAVEDGKLTFLRKKGAHWRSSGVVLHNLPRKVMPCIFMSFTTGYVKVSFDRMRPSTLENIYLGPECDAFGQGLATGWRLI
jgi:hypothetical protein